MPGIYINDQGGGISSSLGSALGQIATNLGPQAQAEAQNLRYRTEAADIANQAASEALQGRDWATSNAGGALGEAGAAPSVAGTAAGLAQPPAPPPLVGSYRHPSGAVLSSDPYTAQVQNWIQSGQATPEAWKTSILPTGQTMVGGPGSDYETRTAIAKQKGMPYDLATGTEHHIPGGGAPEMIVTSQQDPATLEADKADRANAVADAEKRSQLGENAGKSMQEVTRLQDMYNTLVAPGATDDMFATWSDEALRKASDVIGFPLTKASPRLDAIAAIKSRMAALAGNAAQTIQAGTPIRGILDNANRTLADPEANAEQFNSAVEQMKRGYRSQIEAKGPADAYRGSHYTKADTDAFRAALAAQQQREADEFKAEQSAKPPTPTAPAAAPAAPTPTSAPAPAVTQLKPEPAERITRLKILLRNGGDRQKIIDNEKAAGFDASSVL